MSNTDFYSKYFKDNSFLNAKTKKYFYSDPGYMASQGFTPDLNFDNSVIMEIGAGAGRMTKLLFELGLLEKCKKYYVVEPSDGIDEIIEWFADKQCDYMEFHKTDFESLKGNKDVDYIILSGVLPHIDMPLEEISRKLNSLLKDGGLAHVVYSYHGFSKKYAIAIHNYAHNKNKLTRFAIAGLSTFFQFFCFSLGIFRGYYISNFFYSPQKNFIDNFKHQYEYYSINPYNMMYNYDTITEEFVKGGLHLYKRFPYSFAGLFGNDLNSIPDNVTIPDKPLLLLYLNTQDFFFKIVKKNLSGKYGTKPEIKEFSQLEEEDCENYNVIFCWNYFSSPYYKKMSDLTIRFGKPATVYIYQQIV